MPWQEGLLNDILSVRPDGKWAARDAAYLVARQNGKGGVLHAVALAGLFLFDDVREILHSAHEVKTAKKAYRELKELIKNTPYLHAQVERRGSRVVGFRQSNEDTSITITNPDGKTTSVIRFIARATNTGRGFSPQWLIIDEAQICTEESREAIFYSTRAQANPLRVWCGTAPKPNDPSEVFTALRDRGRAGGDLHMSWSEWSVDPNAVIEELRGDDAAVADSNPALGFLVDWETIDSERAAAVSDEAWAGFCREALSWWPDGTGGEPWGVVPRGAWNARLTRDPNADQPGWLTGPVSLSVEMDQAMTRTTISVAGACLEGIGTAVVAVGDGSEWAVDVLATMCAKDDEGVSPVAHVVIDSRSPAGALIADLTEAGIVVTEPPVQDVVKATGQIILMFNEGGIAVRPSDELTAAAGAAKLRRAAAAHVIDRWSADDASPFIGVTLAVWGHQNQPAKETTTTLW